MTFARTTFLALAAVSVSLFAATGASALTLDQAFGIGGTSTVPAAKGFDATSARTAVARPGGGYLVAGSADSDSYFENTWMVTAFTADGRLDPAFGKGGRVMLPKKFGSKWLRYAAANAIAIQPDGEIVVGSTIDVATYSDNKAYWDTYGDPECNCSAERAAFAVIRLTADGRIDRSYGHRGLTLIRSVVRSWDEDLDAYVADIAIDATGGALVYGQSTDIKDPGGWYGPPFGLLYRLSSRGRVDKSFGSHGRVLEPYSRTTDDSAAVAVGVDSAGGITTASQLDMDTRKSKSARRWVLRKYSPRGARVTTYGDAGERQIRFTNRSGADLLDASFAADGTVTVAGTLVADPSPADSDYPNLTGSIVERVTPAGAMDASFGAAGVAAVPPPAGAKRIWPTAMAVRADGGVDLAETYTPAETKDKNGDLIYYDDVGELRSLSSTGQTLADGTGQTVMPLPVLANGYDFWINSIFPGEGATTLIGTRHQDEVRHQDRITLMRVGL